MLAFYNLFPFFRTLKYNHEQMLKVTSVVRNKRTAQSIKNYIAYLEYLESEKGVEENERFKPYGYVTYYRENKLNRTGPPVTKEKDIPDPIAMDIEVSRKTRRKVKTDNNNYVRSIWNFNIPILREEKPNDNVSFWGCRIFPVSVSEYSTSPGWRYDCEYSVSLTLDECHTEKH